jgi:hypothetical protein
MRIGLNVVIPVILALGVAGSILASAEVSAAAVSPSVHVEHTVAVSVGPAMKYRG